MGKVGVRFGEGKGNGWMEWKMWLMEENVMDDGKDERIGSGAFTILLCRRKSVEKQENFTQSTGYMSR